MTEKAIKERVSSTRPVWRRDRSGEAPRDTYWADIPKGVVRDARGFSCSRVFRWPVGGGGTWRVALGVTAGPGVVQYNCRDVQAAESLADILVEYGQPCYVCKRRRPEFAVTIDDRVTEICEKCHQISEDMKADERAEIEKLEESDEDIETDDDGGYEDGLLDMLRDSIRER